jgi:hypothetical protein
MTPLDQEHIQMTPVPTWALAELGQCVWADQAHTLNLGLPRLGVVMVKDADVQQALVAPRGPLGLTSLREKERLLHRCIFTLVR